MPTPSTQAPASPHFALSSAEAEKSLLALILTQPFVGDAILDKCDELRVSPEFFSVPTYSRIYEMILEMRSASSSRAAIDLGMFRVEVAKRGVHAEIGGDQVLDSFEDLDINPAADDHLIKSICEVHTGRRMHDVALSVLREVRTKSSDMASVLDRFQSAVLQISDLSAGARPVRLSSLEGKVMEQFRLMASGVITGIATGIAPLDEITSGFQRKDMIIVAARPSIGKTALALDIAVKMAMPSSGPAGDDGVLFFSLEMGNVQLATRSYIGQSGINPKRAADGLADFSKMRQAAEDLKLANLEIYDKSGVTPMQISAVARSEHKRRKLKAVVVDYLQLVEHPDPGNTPREQQVSYASRSLKALAKELDIPVIVLCQLNRDPAKEQRRPRLSDLRESGAIEQDADVVLLLSRANPDGFGQSEFLLADVAKHRNGPVGDVYLHFSAALSRFRPATPDEVQQLRSAG